MSTDLPATARSPTPDGGPVPREVRPRTPVRTPILPGDQFKHQKAQKCEKCSTTQKRPRRGDLLPARPETGRRPSSPTSAGSAGVQPLTGFWPVPFLSENNPEPCTGTTKTSSQQVNLKIQNPQLMGMDRVGDPLQGPENHPGSHCCRGRRQPPVLSPDQRRGTPEHRAAGQRHGLGHFPGGESGPNPGAGIPGRASEPWLLLLSSCPAPSVSPPPPPPHCSTIFQHVPAGVTGLRLIHPPIKKGHVWTWGGHWGCVGRAGRERRAPA